MTRFPGSRTAAWVIVLAMLASSVAVIGGAGAALPSGGHSASTALRDSGTVAVRGAGAQPVAFGPRPAAGTYAVSFSETGLPAGLEWTVVLGRGSSSYYTDGLTDGIGFVVPNGSYNYQIDDLSGWHQSTIAYKGTIMVSGAAVTEPTLHYLQVTYPVSFSESGLPSGLTFTVTVGGTPQSLTTDGGTDSLAFTAPNGSTPYTITDISGWHQTTLHYSGSVSVSGAAVSEPTLVYTQVTYSVTISEFGLPSGLTWQVTVNGVVESLTTNGVTDSLSWSGLPNGTYSYSITGIAGWTQGTIAPSGSLTITGASLDEPTLEYSRVTYQVTFSESGLPSGLTFQVTVGRQTQSLVTDGATDTLYFTQPNGTATYTITDISGWHQSTLPYSGTVAVSGSPVAETTLVFTQVTYTVTFNELHLPGGTFWAVTLNGNPANSTGTSIAFTEPNGSFPYKVDLVPGYAPTPASGTVTVHGASLSVSISFSQVTYAIDFTESGLPSGMTWSVTFNSITLSSTGYTIGYTAPNGTYGYSIGTLSGWVPNQRSGSIMVNGAAIHYPVTFSPVLYTATFSETGLKSGKTWSVVLDGVTERSAQSSIVFNVGNGTLGYLIAGPSGWQVSSILVPQGTVDVHGGSVSTSVTFVKGPTGSIAFHEKGLGAGTDWCVTLGAKSCSILPTVVFKNLTPATYSYSIETFDHMTTLVSYAGATLSVSGTIPLVHSAGVKVRYAWPVTFTETGLPGSTAWKVSAGGELGTSTSTTITLYLVNGTYAFHVGHVTGYVAAPASGGFKVIGAPLGVAIRFSLHT